MISSYILSRKLFLKRKILSFARVGSLKNVTKKEYGFAVHIL